MVVMNRQKLTITTAAAIVTAAVGFLFIVPTETGLSFAATTTDTGGTTDNGDGNNNNSNGNDKGSTDQGQQQQQQQQQKDDPKTIPQGGPGSGPCEARQCDKEGKPLSCSPHCYPPIVGKPWWLWKPIVIVQHHDTKVVHESSGSSNNGHQLTVAQQNCMYSALQLGFSSNAQNRVDATYAAMMGCLSG